MVIIVQSFNRMIYISVFSQDRPIKAIGLLKIFARFVKFVLHLLLQNKSVKLQIVVQTKYGILRTIRRKPKKLFKFKFFPYLRHTGV